MKLSSVNEESKANLIVGQEYWTYYMETTNKGNRLFNVVKVFKTKLLNREKSQYTGTYLTFSVPNDLKISRTMKHNLQAYMNGYGSASCDYFLTEQEAQQGFDNKIKDFAQYCNVTDRDAMYKKMYTQTVPKQNKEEIEAKKWHKNLTKKELQHLNWFLENTK